MKSNCFQYYSELTQTLKGGKLISRQKAVSYIHSIFKSWNTIYYAKKQSISISDYQWDPFHLHS